jgi:hypothetical protein
MRDAPNSGVRCGAPASDGWRKKPRMGHPHPVFGRVSDVGQHAARPLANAAVCSLAHDCRRRPSVE